MYKKLVAGNWKMNKTIKEAREVVSKLKEKLKDHDFDKVGVLVAPPFTALYVVSEILKDTQIQLGAQNMHWEDKGAFTGEISPEMLKEIGVEYVIIGHSERRKYFGESDDIVNKKIKKAIEKGLKPILCVGENLEQREGGKHKEVVKSQLENSLKGVEDAVMIAYEPVWAIGTGRVATPEQIEDMHVFIKDWHKEKFGEEVFLLYGGSVSPSNVKELLRVKDVIDGFLVGGASLDADKFYEIIRKTEEVV